MQRNAADGLFTKPSILILEIRQCIPVVKIIARLELDKTISFTDGH